MKYIFIFLFIFLFTNKVNASPASIIKPLVDAVVEFVGGLKIFSKPKDEIIDTSNTKIISENFSDEIISNDISKTFVDDTEDALKNTEVGEAVISSNESKSKIILPATGGFVYSKTKNEEEIDKKEDKKNISKK